MALSNLTSLSYSTYATANNGQQFPYIQLSVTTNGPGPAADDVLFFRNRLTRPTLPVILALPDQGNTALNTWQLDGKVGGWWSDDSLAVLTLNTGVLVHSLPTLRLFRMPPSWQIHSQEMGALA